MLTYLLSLLPSLFCICSNTNATFSHFPPHFTELSLKVDHDVVFLFTLKQGLQFCVFMGVHVIQACFLFMFLRDSHNFIILFLGY